MTDPATTGPDRARRLRLIISLAVGASGAAPTTSMSGAVAIIWLSRPRIKAESSTTRTRIFCGI